MMKAYRAIDEVAQRSIASTGMCFSDFAILEAVLHKGPLPVNTAAKLVNLTSGSMTTAVDRLERRGLVRRETDPADRRTRVVHLTREGRDLIERVFARHSTDMEQLAAALRPAERETLLRLLRKLGRAAANTSATGSNDDEPVIQHEQ